MNALEFEAWLTVRRRHLNARRTTDPRWDHGGIRWQTLGPGRSLPVHPDPRERQLIAEGVR